MADMPAELNFTGKPDEDRVAKAAAAVAAEGSTDPVAKDPEKEGASTNATPTQESPLFASPGDPESDEPTEALFDKPSDGKDTVSKETFLKRVGKLVAQRNEARGENKVLREQNKSLDALATVFKEKYGGFDDPGAMAAWDTGFMETAEKLAATNPEVASALALVKSTYEGSPAVEKPTTPTPAAPATPAPVQDPAVQQIIRRDAKRTITDALSGLDVKPAFQEIIADHILNQGNLGEIDRNSAVASARAYIQEKGLTSEDVLSGTKPADPGKKAAEKPKTGSATAAVTKPAPEGGEEAPAGPKSRDEWEANRNSRLASIGKDLGLE
jgi:hypothetical protein